MVNGIMVLQVVCNLFVVGKVTLRYKKFENHCHRGFVDRDLQVWLAFYFLVRTNIFKMQTW